MNIFFFLEKPHHPWDMYTCNKLLVSKTFQDGRNLCSLQKFTAGFGAFCTVPPEGAHTICGVTNCYFIVNVLDLSSASRIVIYRQVCM